MKKLIKLVLGALFTIILLLLAIPLFISADTLKKQVSEQVSKATGRTLEIKGNASLTLFPNIEVSVEDVTLGNTAGFRTPHLIKAKTLATGASLKPLLAGNLNVTGITLEGADIQLEQTAAGARNWDFAKAKEAPKESDSKKGGASAAIKSFALGDISIKDSAVTFIRPGKTIKAEQINLTVKGADARGALKLDGSLTYQGKPVKLSAEVKKLRDVIAGNISPAVLALQLPGGSVNFDGKVQNVKDIAAVGKLAVKLDDIPAILKWASVPAPKLLPKHVDLKGDATIRGKQVSLKTSVVNVVVPGGTLKFNGDAAFTNDISAYGNIDLALNNVAQVSTWATGKAGKNLPKSLSLVSDVTAKNKQYELKNATLKADNVTATGALTANLQGAVPAIAATLKFGMLDLNTLMKTAAAKPSHGWMDAYAAETKGWSGAPLDLSGLRAVNANLIITADALRHDKLEVSNLALRPQLSGGNLTLNIDKASLYGGNTTGAITASANGGQSVGANLTFTSVQIEPLLTALKGKTNLSGTANMKLNLKGTGGSQRAIVSTLNGNGDIRITDGSMKGINLAQFWRDLKNGFLFDSPGKSTDFSELAGTFTVANGLVSNQDLAMKSPALRLTGKGTVNLPARTVNYRLLPSIVATSKGQGGKDAAGIDVPVDITGSIDNPSITPDLAGMVQKQLQDPAALKQNIKDIKETIKDFNSPEDLGKVLFGGGKNEEPAPAPAASAPAPATAPSAPEAPPPAPAPAAQPAPQLTPEEQLIQGVGGLLKGL